MRLRLGVGRQPLQEQEGGGGDAEIGVGSTAKQPLQVVLRRRRGPLPQRRQGGRTHLGGARLQDVVPQDFLSAGVFEGRQQPDHRGRRRRRVRRFVVFGDGQKLIGTRLAMGRAQ